MFISFEGMDGCGKSTHVGLLAKRLSDLGYRVVTTREPGGTALGEQLRQLLLGRIEDEPITIKAETLLFAASRAQLTATVIKPALSSGAIVIADRFSDSTLVYQCLAHQLDDAPVKGILAYATGELKPDLTVLLDLDEACCLGRLTEARDYFEDQELAFHRRVRQGFLSLAEAEPERWLKVSTAARKEQVAEVIFAAVQARLQSDSESA